VAGWYAEKSGGRVLLDISVQHTEFQGIPFEDYNPDPSWFSWGIARVAGGERVPLAIGHDIVVVLPRPEDWLGLENQGVMLGDLTAQRGEKRSRREAQAARMQRRAAPRESLEPPRPLPHPQRQPTTHSELDR
jgi:hypothetical protein